ncbi:hypothetical protein GCM10028832_05700 [Streptomyces sparsus]
MRGRRAVRELPRSPAREPPGRRILAAAEQLFYDRGITAVGVDLIAEQSGVTKRTLCNQFGWRGKCW